MTRIQVRMISYRRGITVVQLALQMPDVYTTNKTHV